MACERLSWDELVSAIWNEFSSECIDVDRMKEIMSAYHSNERDWRKFALFDPHRYTRNLVDKGNDNFNLIVLCWGEGHGSSIHDHQDSHCFMKMLDGQLVETMYSWPEHSDESGRSSGMKQTGTNLHSRDAVTYISDEIGLHRVANPSHTEKAISLHLYCPPFQQCQTFDARSCKKNTCRVVFHSQAGCLCKPT